MDGEAPFLEQGQHAMVVRGGLGHHLLQTPAPGDIQAAIGKQPAQVAVLKLIDNQYGVLQDPPVHLHGFACLLLVSLPAGNKPPLKTAQNACLDLFAAPAPLNRYLLPRWNCVEMSAGVE